MERNPLAGNNERRKCDFRKKTYQLLFGNCLFAFVETNSYLCGRRPPPVRIWRAITSHLLLLVPAFAMVVLVGVL